MGTYEEKDFDISEDGKFLRGVAWIPEGRGPFPTVVVCHGLGGTHHYGKHYAERLCPKGFAVYSFDFRGGSPYSESSGRTQEMSLRSEAADLDTALSHVHAWDFADPNRVFLVGESQGGIVCAMVAAERPDDAAGMALLYPGFQIPDAVRSMFPGHADIPDAHNILDWFPAGRPYAEDVYDYDPYSDIGRYAGPVLLLHGDQDHLVPVSYSQRAAEVYPDAELHIIEGAGHGLEGPDAEVYMRHVVPFLVGLM